MEGGIIFGHPIPPNDEPRAPDGFAYRTVYCEIIRNIPHFDMIVSQTYFSGLSDTYLRQKTIHCPARTTDNRDVLIHLMAIGQDRGERHRNDRMALTRYVGAIMQFLSCENKCTRT